MIYLRQSTASQEVLLGPFVDSTDGVTAETALTIANTDIKVFKAGATTLANKNSGGATHISNGNYYAVLDATDTDTVGSGALVVQVSGALAVRVDFHVLEEAVFDGYFAASALGYIANAPVNVAQFGGSNGTFASGRPEVNTSHWAGTAVASATVRADLINIAGAAVSTTTAQLGVNAVQISGDGIAADNLENAFDDTAGAVPWQGIIDQGTAQSATGTTLVLRAAASFGDDTPIGATLLAFGSTQGYWQSRLITDYVSATDTATVDTWTVTPSGTITYKILGTAPGSASSAPTAAQIADAVWDEATSGHTTAGTFGEQCATDIDAILVDTGTTLDGRIPAALVSGRMDASVGAMAANVITAAATAADFTTEVTSGLATAAALDAVDNFVDTEVAAIKTVVDAIQAKTDSLTFTVAGVVDANVQRINDVTITGNGSPGTEFGV